LLANAPGGHVSNGPSTRKSIPHPRWTSD
jgi:hypothetical protein